MDLSFIISKNKIINKSIDKYKNKLANIVHPLTGKKKDEK